jgi:hypothetical protein
MIGVLTDLTKRSDAMPSSDVGTQEAYELIQQKTADEPTLSATIAEFFLNRDATETLRAVLVDDLQPRIFHEGKYLALLDLFRNLRRIQVPREKLFLISVSILAKLAIDAQAAGVRDSVNSGGAAVRDPEARQLEGDVTHMQDSETQRRRELADRLGLPSLSEAIETVREHHKIAADKTKLKPEEFKDYGHYHRIDLPPLRHASHYVRLV